MKKTILLITLIVTFATGCEDRDESNLKEESVSEIFKKIDTNADKQISRKEFNTPFVEDFALIDLDKDGFIIESEFNQFLINIKKTTHEKTSIQSTVDSGRISLPSIPSSTK